MAAAQTPDETGLFLKPRELQEPCAEPTLLAVSGRGREYFIREQSSGTVTGSRDVAEEGLSAEQTRAEQDSDRLFSPPPAAPCRPPQQERPPHPLSSGIGFAHSLLCPPLLV
ncbi:hypothetical protein H920_11134 [Fukomys damarensis]|uniref:Uncharacterized protein n=1 Tax=Fukomys damarensis TaxID=885580 RepID=A0A091DAX9_FUKDA|nr:hypothetical protein H920_11134 [Fukomys damarensis]